MIHYLTLTAVALDKRMSRHSLPREALHCDAVRIIIYTEQEFYGIKEDRVEDIIEFNTLDKFITQFNKKRDHWANLPWPSSCKLEFSKKT